MQMLGSKPECASGRTHVRSDRMNGAADNADAQTGKKENARGEQGASRDNPPWRQKADIEITLTTKHVRRIKTLAKHAKINAQRLDPEQKIMNNRACFCFCSTK